MFITILIKNVNASIAKPSLWITTRIATCYSGKNWALAHLHFKFYNSVFFVQVVPQSDLHRFEWILFAYIVHLHKLILREPPNNKIRWGLNHPSLKIRFQALTIPSFLIKFDRRWPLGTFGLDKRSAEVGNYFLFILQ